jgi:filamentous hemagglutinin
LHWLGDLSQQWEMSELVGDLQADKKYYQTNIALAASSLAAKTTALAAQLATAAASSGIGNQIGGN